MFCNLTKYFLLFWQIRFFLSKQIHFIIWQIHSCGYFLDIICPLSSCCKSFYAKPSFAELSEQLQGNTQCCNPEQNLIEGLTLNCRKLPEQTLLFLPLIWFCTKNSHFPACPPCKLHNCIAEREKETWYTLNNLNTRWIKILHTRSLGNFRALTSTCPSRPSVLYGRPGFCDGRRSRRRRNCLF